MKRTWKEIKAIAERNALFLDQAPDDFLQNDSVLAEKDLVNLLWLLIDDFETEDGRIKKNQKNFLLVNMVDEVFSAFKTGAGFVLISKLISKLQKVVSNNFGYYKTMLGDSSLFKSTSSLIVENINRRLGLKPDGSMVKDGYVSTLFNDKTVQNEAREIFYNGVISQNKPSDLRSLLNEFIVGEKDKKGAVSKFYSSFAYDTFGQIDRQASVQFAEVNQLRWFVYAGTLIKTSRPFCVKKIHGVYNTEEADLWIFENPKPLGVSAATYKGVVDMGGENCRHVPLFLTEEIKDDLKEKGY